MPRKVLSPRLNKSARPPVRLLQLEFVTVSKDAEWYVTPFGVASAQMARCRDLTSRRSVARRLLPAAVVASPPRYSPGLGRGTPSALRCYVISRPPFCSCRANLMWAWWFWPARAKASAPALSLPAGAQVSHGSPQVLPVIRHLTALLRYPPESGAMPRCLGAGRSAPLWTAKQ
jgi:hypothetical protein